MNKSIRHILSLSGGKDSAALAVYMRDQVPEMEYIFHDTDKELPETYEYLYRLEAILGKKITYTTPEHSFDKWLAVYGGMIPSNHRRWCTKMLKIKPFEDYVGNDIVINYVGLRADEKRDGYLSPKPNITAVHPFKEDGLCKSDIMLILEESGLGLPPYMDWGRTRSGCFFCFYQQKIEWVRLKQVHPDLFQKALEYEYVNQKNGNPFYWNKHEPLIELQKPERMKQIEENWERSKLKKSLNRPNRPLIEVLGGANFDDEPEGCLICSL